ncbi:MAG: diguanylate cyclase [Angelakisella sp.]|nr:diguanylate cyclase [Angelakisella sp.]
MTKYNIALQKRKSIFMGIVAAILLFAIFLSFILMLRYSLKNREALETTQRYMTFESKVTQLIHSNIALLKGFDAHIKASADFDEESANHYLDYLLSWDSGYIRNIGVLEDTTILWNYPQESNAETIGTDLAKIESQRDLVIKTKEKQTAVFQGPIDLIQGDSGFSVRLPIVREDTGYWGQISIILKKNKIMEEIASYAQSSSLDLAIFNHENNDIPFFGSVSSSKQHLIFDMDPSFINWRVCVYLTDNWSGNLLMFITAILFSAVFSAIVGNFVCKYLEKNYRILNISTHDYLTGLFNRHFLNEYQGMVLAAAKRKDCKVAILMMDINRFKKINDTYGHDVGDKVLIETARILQDCTRKNEAVFRLGGDEFLMLFPEVSGEQDLELIKERLNKCFVQEFKVLGYSIKVELSLGEAVFPKDGENFEALLREADKRLYRAKTENRKYNE